MENIKYVFFILFVLFVNVFYVQASCTNEELSQLKELANDIKVTYKHLGKIENEEGIFYNRFNVTVNNIPDDFYILTLENTIKMEPNNQTIKQMFNNGTWYFDIYSNSCEEIISVIKVHIPKFNKYSLDPLCEGIDGTDFPLCGKYYEYTDQVTPNEFQERVKHYRSNYNINDNNNNSSEENTFKVVFNNIIDFIFKYKIYILIIVLFLLLSLGILFLFRKNRKRGVLE